MRVTLQQLEVLVQFLEDNPSLAKGLLKTANGKLQIKRMWEDASNRLNALGGAMKDGKGWAKFWADKKCLLKRHCAIKAASMRQTGGGVDKLPNLSEVEERMVAVMGGYGFAQGDGGAVNPFPNSSQQSTQQSGSSGGIQHCPNTTQEILGGS